MTFIDKEGNTIHAGDMMYLDPKWYPPNTHSSLTPARVLSIEPHIGFDEQGVDILIRFNNGEELEWENINPDYPIGGWILLKSPRVDWMAAWVKRKESS